jgi:hypothetical protein
MAYAARLSAHDAGFIWRIKARKGRGRQRARPLAHLPRILLTWTTIIVNTNVRRTASQRAIDREDG